MVLKKEAGRKDNPGKAGRGAEAALSYQVFSVENSSSAQQLPPTGNLLEYAESRISYLSAQLAERTNELERLREYTAQLEEGEKGLIQELTQQLAIKDHEISRIAGLCAKKESENRKLSASFEANINSQREYAERIKSILVRKEGETARLIEGLQKELEKKDTEIDSLRRSVLEKSRGADLGLPEENIQSVQSYTLQRELESRNRELKKLEKLLLDEQKLNSSVQSRLKQQILEMAGHAGQLRSFIVEKEKVMQSLESTFEDRLAAKDAELNRVKGLLHETLPAQAHSESASLKVKMDEHAKHAEKVIEHLRKELESRETEIISLREQLLKKAKAGTLASPGAEAGIVYPGFTSAQAELLLRNSEEKDRELKKLEKTLFDEQKLNKSVQTRLKEQMAEMAGQIEGLKSFIIEKEKVVQNLESAFEKRMAAKEDELRHLKGLIHAKPETRLHRQADELKSELHIKEETAKLMADEIAKVKEQSALLRKRLEERQRIFFESEKAYEELIAKLREQHEARVKAIVQEAAQKEVLLKSALEEEKIKLQRETTLMREKEKQVEDALQAFASTSQKLIRFGEAATLGGSEAGVALTQLREKEWQIEEKEKRLEEQLEEEKKQIEESGKYVHDKQMELKKLLAETEARIAELKSKEEALAGKEAAVERKEQLLLKEQEAIGKELDVLASAGVEIGRSKQYIQQKLEQMGGFEQPVAQSQQAWQPQQAVQAPIEMALEQEQPFLPQARPQQRQQPSMQETGLGQLGAGAGVEEAQEEEGADVPRFTGLTPTATVKETPLEATEEDEALTSATPAIKAVAAQKLKAKVKTTKLPKQLSKKQQKIAIKKLKSGKMLKKTAPQKRITKPIMQAKAQAKIPAKPAAKESANGLPSELSAKPDQELFTEMGGYSELEEIKSIVDVGLQHGDSIEQIRQSLTVSGYSKKNIEKVLSSVKK